MKTVLATLALIVLLLGFMLLASLFPGQSAPLINATDTARCRAAYSTPIPQVENGYTANKFEQVIQQSEFDACVLAGSLAVDCGENHIRLVEGPTNLDANKCSVSAFKDGQPFIFREASSGIDDIRNLWIIGPPDRQIYFIFDGYFLSLGQAITTTTFLCTKPLIEKSWFSPDVESIGCEEGTKLKEETTFPYAPY